MTSVSDRSFDRLIPHGLRHFSRIHWTPVEIALRTTALLAPTRRTRVLDVGAGIGKLCIIGAMASEGMWCGVEHHQPLVDAARELAARLDLAARTMFVHADAFAIEWREFDVIYLYNPFETPLFVADDTAEGERMRSRIEQTERRLAELDEGTRVVTLHGFGGVIPPSFELLYQERVPAVGLELVLWRQRSSSRRCA